MLNFAIFRHRAARATGLTFAGSGLIFGTWAALIPYVKQKFGLDEAQLGLLLLCAPAGIVIMNSLSVPVLMRFGPVVSALGALSITASLGILPVALPSIWLVAVSLLFWGAGMGFLNIAMNTCASLLKQGAGLRIFSTCHGLWSTGAMAGAALAGSITGLGLQPTVYVLAIAAGILLLAWGLKRPLHSVPAVPVANPGTVQKTSGFIMPNKALWVLIIVSLCTNLTEGTMSDWSAVYMREVLGAGEALAGWGFAAYALFMAAGRFVGDGLIAFAGPNRVLRAGGLVAASGLLLLLFVQTKVIALAGFALTGAGVSIGAPILYAAATRVPGLPPGAGLATMNTFAMVAFLGGPAFIGFLAKAFSLPIAFGLVALLACIWIWKAGQVEK